MTGRLAKKTVLITGAGSGIGRATALRFAREGAAVCVVDVVQERSGAVAKEIEAAGGRASCFVADVADPQQVRAAVAAAMALGGGRLDVMVNNAALAHGALLADTKDEDWRRVMSVTLDGVFYGTREALAVMVPQGSGVILNVSSGAGLAAELSLGAYGSAKAAVINLTRSAAVENASHGVRVNAICPGPIETPSMMAWLDHIPGGRRAFERQVPQGRMGTADEMANVALFLASDDASYVNGAVIVADGAISARTAAPRFD